MYLADPRAPARATSLPGMTRFAAILRNPVDRAWSHYWHARTMELEDRRFEDAIRDELEGRAPHLYGSYVTHGRYGEHLARWRDAVGSGRMEVVSFERLKTMPTELFSDVCRSVGIDSSVVPRSVGRRYDPERCGRAGYCG